MIVQQKESYIEDTVSQILKVEIARLGVLQSALEDSECPALAEQVGETIDQLEEALFYVDDEWSENDD